LSTYIRLVPAPKFAGTNSKHPYETQPGLLNNKILPTAVKGGYCYAGQDAH
jgi:hypothetical protein